MPAIAPGERPSVFCNAGVPDGEASSGVGCAGVVPDTAVAVLCIDVVVVLDEEADGGALLLLDVGRGPSTLSVMLK